jgi:hypothetical protein
MNNILRQNLNLLDWDFKGVSTKDLFPHNISWYPSRYIPQIPAMLINELSKEGDLVLDPFCGSGTTLVEAVRLKRRCVGIDINPLAKIMTDAKLELLNGKSFTELEVLSVIDEVQSKQASIGFVQYRSSLFIDKIKIEELESWYHPNTLSNLFIIWDVIERREGALREVLRLLFVSISMSTSGLDTKKPYTYYADRVKPSKQMIEKDALQFFISRITRLTKGMGKSFYGTIQVNAETEVSNILEANLEPYGNFDLIVTSPPYLGVTDYNAGFRLAHLWYDFNEELNSLKQDEIGARYKRRRKQVLDDYLFEMKSTFTKCVDSLKTGGYMCLVIGESAKYQNKIIEPLSNFVINDLGMTSEAANNRNVNQNYFLHASGGVKKEEILVFRK